MKKRFLFILTLSFSLSIYAQTDSLVGVHYNSADRLLEQDGRLLIGGYAQIDYNQPFDSDIKSNGTLDVHRLVMLFGYSFNSRTKFITEIEYEHVKEVYIEQAFLQYKINNYINFRGGLLLIPMGIINEYHEPTTFNGVERPLTDKYIAPTTWREIGFGFTGTIIPASIKYQAYLINGFLSYDGSATLNGKNGLRKGRQKGAESIISTPNLAARIEYFGLKGLNIGFSGYFGKTQSELYNGLDKNDENAGKTADSSVVGISMAGLDVRYSVSGFNIRGQFYYTFVSNTKEYNIFTGSDDGPNDLGSSMTGYYIEAAYNVFAHSQQINSQLLPFLRYEGYNTHHSVSDENMVNSQYNHSIITTGMGWKITPGAMIKADLQFRKTAADDQYQKVFNAGVAIMF